MSLYKMLKGIDDAPFTGVREIDPTPVVLRDLSAEKFSDNSLYGNDSKKWYELMAEKGLHLGTVYTAVQVEGYGDVFDVIIQLPNGKDISVMDIAVEEPPRNTLIKKGQRLMVKHSRSGTWEGIATQDFDTENDEWYHIALDQDQIVYGMANEWERGDNMPARRGLCKVEVIA